MPELPERLPHYASLTAALFAGFWAAVNAPATSQFEQTMRALDITGQVLAPLSLLTDAGATVIAMAVVYFVVRLVFERIQRALTARGQSPGNYHR